MKTPTKFFLSLALLLGMLTTGPFVSKAQAQYDYSSWLNYYSYMYSSSTLPTNATYPSAVINTPYPVGGYYTYSDVRLKKNITPISGSLQKVNGLQAYHYLWKDPSKGEDLQTGLMAQELEKTFPELVKTDRKGIRMVNYVGLIPHLLESVKELTAENLELKIQEKEYKKQNDLIVGRLEALEAKLNLALNGKIQSVSSSK